MKKIEVLLLLGIILGVLIFASSEEKSVDLIILDKEALQ
jgi:hypothetical protein